MPQSRFYSQELHDRVNAEQQARYIVTAALHDQVGEEVHIHQSKYVPRDIGDEYRVEVSGCISYHKRRASFQTVCVLRVVQHHHWHSDQLPKIKSDLIRMPIPAPVLVRRSKSQHHPHIGAR